MRIPRLAGLLAITAVCSSSEAQAQVEFSVTPVVGGTFFLADPPTRFALHRAPRADLILEDAAFDDTWHLGVNAGFAFSEMWAVEGMFTWFGTELTANGLSAPEKGDGFMYGINGFFFLPIESRLKPYVSVGTGAETFTYQDPDIQRHTEWMGNAALGLQYRLSDTAGLRFEARDCFARFNSGLALVDDTWENDLMVSMGLSFIWPIG